MKKRYNIRTVQHRRKREGKTDYKKRLSLLTSGNTRFVYRVSSKNIRVQLVNFDAKGDKVLASVCSKDLNKLGWIFSGKNIPAAYILGYMMGKKAAKLRISEAILDIGLYHHKKKAKMYAAVKGAVDAGLKVPVSEKALPDEKRLNGKHIQDYYDMLKKEDPDRFKAVFSAYSKKDEISKISNIIEDIKKKID